MVTNFYPRPPRGGRRHLCRRSAGPGKISIHALREEGDASKLIGLPSSSLFLSTPSARRATWTKHDLPTRQEFLSTPSARRATQELQQITLTLWISIHALREEGDARMLAIGGRIAYFYPRPPRGGRRFLAHKCPIPPQFLSTPSARRATDGPLPVSAKGPDFYPRPPRGGRHREDLHGSHAGEFLSTPSARRATQEFCSCSVQCRISIHALREEGDAASLSVTV